MSVLDTEVLHVVIQGTLNDGTIVQNRKRFKCSFVAPQTEAAVLTAVDTWVETLYGFVASQIDANVVLDQGTVDVIEWNGTDAIWEVVRNIGVYSPLDTFSNLADPLPNQCAAFVIGNTGRPKTKGRLFVFPFGEDMQDHGVLTAGALTALGNLAAQYILTQSLGGGNDLISGVVREAANAWWPFGSVSYADSIGTQRRRRAGVGI